MKKWLMLPALLVVLAIASSARAQIGHGQGAATPCAPVVSNNVITYEEVTVKSCKTVPDKKKTTKTVYDCKCEDFCLPKCPSLLSRLFNRCGDCDGCGPGDRHSCEKPRTKKVLVKRIVTKQEDSFKCVVEERKEKVPICAPACGTVTSTPAKIDLLPAPQAK